LIESLESLEAFSSLGGDSSAEDKVKEIIAELLGRVDEPFNEEEVYEKVKPQDQNPLKIVLIQEISRYNKLLKMVRKNLQDLEKGINGLVLIS
jgi:dynein heavy chain